VRRIIDTAKSGLPRGEWSSITAAFQRALGDHGACFYDGMCEPAAVRDTVRAVERATRDLDHLCARLLAGRARSPAPRP
jgi:hypothetical protein